MRAVFAAAASALFAASFGASTSAAAQNDFSDVVLKTEKLAARVHVLYGAGGNVGVFLGDTHSIIVDDQFAPLAPRIAAKVAALKDQPIHTVINTHWHGDHSGGNAYFGEAGAMIIAHDNVRARMESKQVNGFSGGFIDASPDAALPVLTYSFTSTLYNSGEKIELIHVEDAHTDGDTLVFFRTSNVIHMGDTFFYGRWPYIDTGSGGGLANMIDAHDIALATIKEDTAIIPGHGLVTTKAGLKETRDMLAVIQAKAIAAAAQGMDADAFINSGPAAGFPDVLKASGAAWTKRFLAAAFQTAQ